uniref:zinc finger protein 771-like n=1 Tax=Doryrhamphus excisus TaxID=161450 RepID=UPI0025AE8AA6|nr:zinc finger protein 771-like [Doryrhamphus excisus]
MKMLKELVKERLMAAADEIFQLFEKAISSYEEELCRTREEKERLCQQMSNNVGQTRTVLHFEDVQKMTSHRLHVKEEEDKLWTNQEGECLLRLEETDLTKLPLTVVYVKPENKPLESSQLHPSESDGNHNLLAPGSNNDDTQEPSSSDANSEIDLRAQLNNKDSECSKNETEKKRLVCLVCGESFPNNSALTRHARTHTGEKPFRCSVCGKTFSQKSHMVKHTRTHTGEKPFSCSVCRQRFSQKSNIISHMRTHTGEKPFVCSVCGRRFSEKSNIVTHMRTHTGEKPFSCSLCGKTFAERVSMTKHMRTHTGEKPYVCSICDKSFTQKVNMTTHMKTHSGEKPYTCSVCDRRFSNKVNMVKHENTHRR